MFFVLCLCCLGSLCEFVHVPSTELSLWFQRYTSVGLPSSCINCNYCTYYQPSLPVWLSVPLIELSSSCKSHKHYTFFWSPHPVCQPWCSFRWASFVLQKLQLLHLPPAFGASLCVPLVELWPSCKSHKSCTFHWPPHTALCAIFSVPSVWLPPSCKSCNHYTYYQPSLPVWVFP